MKPYSLSEVHQVCQDQFNYLNNINDCEDAVPWIRSKYPDMSRDVSKTSHHDSHNYPSGCYVNLGTFKGIYFNTGSTNTPARSTRQVCVKGTMADAYYIK